MDDTVPWGLHDHWQQTTEIALWEICEWALQLILSSKLDNV